MELRYRNYRVTTYSDAKIYRLRDWKLYGFYSKWPLGMSLGPILFFKLSD